MGSEACFGMGLTNRSIHTASRRQGSQDVVLFVYQLLSSGICGCVICFGSSVKDEA